MAFRLYWYVEFFGPESRLEICVQLIPYRDPLETTRWIVCYVQSPRVIGGPFVGVLSRRVISGSVLIPPSAEFSYTHLYTLHTVSAQTRTFCSTSLQNVLPLINRRHSRRSLRHFGRVTVARNLSQSTQHTHIFSWYKPCWYSHTIHI